ncbi:hypothetical protein NCC49_004266 [Naganishia albida]|nr:hypothetical protein NCC49_004266 [Naganishia albida]
MAPPLPRDIIEISDDESEEEREQEKRRQEKRKQQDLQREELKRAKHREEKRPQREIQPDDSDRDRRREEKRHQQERKQQELQREERKRREEERQQQELQQEDEEHESRRDQKRQRQERQHEEIKREERDCEKGREENSEHGGSDYEETANEGSGYGDSDDREEDIPEEDLAESAKEALKGYESWEAAVKTRKLFEIHQFATRRKKTDDDESFNLRKAYFMIYILVVDLVKDAEMEYAASLYGTVIASAKGNKRLKESGCPIHVVNDQITMRQGELHAEVNFKLGQVLISVKLFLPFALFLHHNPHMGPVLERCDIDDLVKGIPAISIPDAVSISQSFGEFWFDSKVVPIDRLANATRFEGVAFMPAERLRMASGIYFFVDRFQSQIRAGSTATSFECRSFQHYQSLYLTKKASARFREMVGEKGWEELERMCMVAVPARHKGIMVEAGIYYALEVIAILLTQATDPAYGGALTNVVDFVSHPFRLLKVSQDDVEELWKGIYMIGKNSQFGLPPINQPEFMEMIRPVNKHNLCKQTICELIGDNGRYRKYVRAKLMEEYNLHDPEIWLLGRRAQRGTVVKDQKAEAAERKNEKEEKNRDLPEEPKPAKRR